MSSEDRILVGYDEQPAGRDALVLGELLARTLGAGLLVARISDRARESEERRIRDRLSAAFAGADVRWVIARSPAAALAELAMAEPGVALIVVGSTHRAGFGRVMPGPVFERLLGAARMPVAIAPRGFAGGPADQPEAGFEPAESLRVLAVAYDGSAEAEAALRLAGEIALRAEATVRVIAVGVVVDPTGFAEPAAASVPARPDLQERLHEAVGRLPAELRALPIYERGIPAARILARAEEGVDLIVMGSRGHGPLSAALLGSTSSAVVSRASCPVIVTPRPAAP